MFGDIRALPNIYPLTFTEKHMASPKKNKNGVVYHSLEPARAFIVIVFLIVGVWYLYWRLGTFNYQSTAAIIFSYTIYAAEIFGFLTTLMHLFMVWRLTEREAPAPKSGKTVDVFITTINEPVTMVRRTVLTAMEMEYPHKTYILDDGNRPEMRGLAEELGCGYIARTSNEDAKAGNLNNALKHTTGEYIAVFDADHAPKKSFLTRTLGYFEDPDVSFVQTPQDFYNLDSFQHRGKAKDGRVWTEQGLFFRVIQKGKDFWNAAFFCGSCAIISRSSLNKIGGFATGTVTEDLHTSLLIHKEGYKSVYHSESLAFGIAPSQIEPFINQRIRWGQGAMQVWRKEGILFTKGLTIPQRINYFASMITYFDGWQKFIFYIAPVIVLMTGLMPIINDMRTFLIHFVPYMILTFWIFEEVGRGYGKAFSIEQYNMTRFFAFLWSTLGLFRGNLKFKVTKKDAGGMPSYTKFLMPQYFIFVLNVSAIFVGMYLYVHRAHMYEITYLTLAANVFWACANFILAGAVLAFTIARSGYLRQHYRFAIPLVMKFRIPSKDEDGVYGAVDDISSYGFMVMADVRSTLRSGEVFEGELYLPTGALAFKARTTTQINTLPDSTIKSIGCEFLWESRKQQDQLELFLYGSDLEWRIQQIDEQIKTPLEYLFGNFHRPENPLPPATHWSSALCRDETTPDGKVQSGVITLDLDAKRRNLVVFSPLNIGAKVETSVFTRSGWRTLKGTIVKENRVENAVGQSLYVYQMDQKAAIRV